MIGLKQGTVMIEEHQDEWVVNANQIIDKFKSVFDDYIVDTQHVGSTSIPLIKAKPIIDLVIGIKNVDRLKQLECLLEREGLTKSLKHQVDGDVLYLIKEEEAVTHHVHIVVYNGLVWKDYLGFRDYLIQNPTIAQQYNELKERLSCEHQNNRIMYTNEKSEFIIQILNRINNAN